MIPIPHVYTVDSREQLYDVAQTLEDDHQVSRDGTVLIHDEETDEYTTAHWRDGILNQDGQGIGDVSASDKHYKVHQFSDIMRNVARASEEYDDHTDLHGNVMVSDDDRKLSSYLEFDEIGAEPFEGDRINLGLKTRSAHTGVHGTRYDLGATRLICSNGMTAFVADSSFNQTHNDELSYALAQRAVDSIVNGADAVEQRIQEADERRFKNYDEAVITLMDNGIGAEFDDPVSLLRDALDAETDERTEEPSLWDAYNAATRVYTHGDGLDHEQRDRGLDRSAQLLDDYGAVPDAERLGRQAVTSRSEQLASEDAEPLFENEQDAVSELLAMHGDSSAA
ncbi:DUF945 domain-containing protein [Halogeometricum borinquense]|uniref:DUF945 domain-containing protein n=1 Tax=Halogeometricum borinquense TaxID=60847 RepID=A0A6C0UJN3_9EURY|nr:DUF932 domain-containing protein [Halogeometricum borinquense]QIB75390.1 DUF945 domain-containing protein [Halogeometricum borinquense]